MSFIKKIKPIYKLLVALRSLIFGGAMRLMHFVCGVKQNKAVFSCNKGKSVSDSPCAIAEALHKIDPKADIVFQVKDGVNFPEWARGVKAGSLKWLYEMATSRVYCDNFNRPFYQIKFADQKYVQTWHGDRGCKRVLYDMDPDGGFPDNKYLDLCVAGSEFCKNMYRTGFKYDGEVLVNGLPRNDCLVHPMDIIEAKKKCGLDTDKKHVLYAPTFRDRAKGGDFAADIDLELARVTLENKTGDTWQVVTRAHEQNRAVSGSALDYTDFGDMALLMQACDMMISDYSSCPGDFVLLNRPCLLYHGENVFDRELYFRFEDSPFVIAHDSFEMVTKINAFDDESTKKNCEDILKFFGANETGHSAVDVAKIIDKWLKTD